MAYGVTSTGFVEKNLSTILDEIEADEKATLGAAINTLATSVIGQANGIMAGQLRELWEVAAAVYRAMYPDSSSDDALENVAAITGTLRLAATETTVTVHCTGTPATVLTVGRVVSTGAADRFESTTQKTITAATAWAINTPYVLGDIVTNNSNIYVCVQAGTSAGAGGPTGTGDSIVDNTCKWNFVGDGTGYAAVPFQAEETGPVSCAAGAIETEDGIGAIETPVAGWDDSRNLADGTTGRSLETDAAFRLRREVLLAATGAATIEAILADIVAVTGVVEAHVYENITLVTDADGVPGKAFEAVVQATAVDAATAAQIVSGNEDTYDLTDADTLKMKIDGGAEDTATFNIADFVDIDNATAAEVAVVINTDIAGVTAAAVTVSGYNYIQIMSNTTGAVSSVEITGGTGTYTALGFPETPIVANGIDVKVAGEIWESKPAGIEAHGDFNVAVQDSQEDYHLIGITNPTAIPIYIDATLTTDDDFPSDGVAQVKAALAAFGNALGVGGDVIFERLQAVVFTISGVTDITAFEVDTTTPPVGVINISITGRQLATFDTGDIRIPNP